jgi:NADPH-dependent 2,4-dienoyl-CoA reductase/sulfur reductase-like enzyme
MTRAAPVIVGAGPAGVRAAQTLVAHGVRPIVIDEAAQAGGQIYRQPPADSCAAARRSMVSKPVVRNRCTAPSMALREAIDYRPNTLVWNAQPGLLDLMDGSAQSASTLAWEDIIVATGATDRVLPFPGWTTPGVYTLGGSQVALKFQGCAIGRSVVLAGNGPLLYLVAYQYAKAGARVAACSTAAAWPTASRHCPPCWGSRPCWPRASTTSPGSSCTACRCIRTRGCCVWKAIPVCRRWSGAARTWQARVASGARAAHCMRCRRLRLCPAF